MERTCGSGEVVGKHCARQIPKPKKSPKWQTKTQRVTSIYYQKLLSKIDFYKQSKWRIKAIDINIHSGLLLQSTTERKIYMSGVST